MKTAVEIPIDRMFRAVSDRTRLRILNLLRDKEVCVCDIVDGLRTHQPLVSRHLAYLRRAGLVRARKQGLWMFYRLAPATTVFHKNLLACLRSCFVSQPEFVTDAKRLKTTKCSDESPGAEGCCA